ncbi:hypothetical protein RND71_024989 [Anisodus tanguticus]|uniref:Uncharacterized protein n=1 Tax=Anisodus tanguticus TaxID=243964 RepID=A0AAE1V4F6_9SOLA|nr:hypothetical protein RND71_024989 [Anisodus tanguticus]
MEMTCDVMEKINKVTKEHRAAEIKLQGTIKQYCAYKCDRLIRPTCVKKISDLKAEEN